MTERSRRAFLKSAAVGGALTGGAVLLLAGLARAAARPGPLPPAPQPRATTYRLAVTNDSSTFETFAVYQDDPDLGVPNVMNLAWLVKSAQPGQSVVFEWTTDFDFLLWGDNGVNPSQSVPANPDDLNHNQIELTYAYGLYSFQPSQPLPDPELGSLYVRESSTIPVDSYASVGLGMSGAPLYSTRAQPNMQLTFTPHPNQHLFLTAGTFSAGQNLDVQQISTAAEIDYAPDVVSVHAILNRNNVWKVSADSGA